jgi:hypothetical protein
VAQRPDHEEAAAIRTKTIQPAHRAAFAERALERTDECAGLIGGQIEVAALAVRPL